MSAATLLQELTEEHVELWLEGDKLRYRGSSQVLTPEMLTRMKESKPALVGLLAERTLETETEVRDFARQRLNPEGIDHGPPPVPPAPPGRDPLVHQDTDKAKFFSHSVGCECEICIFPEVRYARSYRAKDERSAL